MIHRLTKERLTQGAFWHEWVCMDCGALAPSSEECEECDGDDLMSCETALRLLDAVEEGESDEEGAP